MLFPDSPLDRIDQVWTHPVRRNNAVERADLERPLNAVHAVEFSCHFAQLFGMNDLEELIPLRSQAYFFWAFSFADRLRQLLEPRILARTSFDFTREHNRCCRSAAN